MAPSGSISNSTSFSTAESYACDMAEFICGSHHADDKALAAANKTHRVILGIPTHGALSDFSNASLRTLVEDLARMVDVPPSDVVLTVRQMATDRLEVSADVSFTSEARARVAYEELMPGLTHAGALATKLGIEVFGRATLKAGRVIKVLQNASAPPAAHGNSSKNGSLLLHNSAPSTAHSNGTKNGILLHKSAPPTAYSNGTKNGIFLHKSAPPAAHSNGSQAGSTAWSVWSGPQLDDTKNGGLLLNEAAGREEMNRAMDREEAMEDSMEEVMETEAKRRGREEAMDDKQPQRKMREMKRAMDKEARRKEVEDTKSAMDNEAQREETQQAMDKEAERKDAKKASKELDDAMDKEERLEETEHAMPWVVSAVSGVEDSAAVAATSSNGSVTVILGYSLLSIKIEIFMF